MSPEQSAAEKELAKRTRRSLLAMGGGILAAAVGAGWLASGNYNEGDIPPNFRRVFGANEKLVRSSLYSNNKLAPTFPASAIGKLKVNGEEGLEYELEPEEWRLEVKPYGSSGVTSKLVMADVKSLPRHEEIIEFKCVEGWSTVTKFAGARFSDFTAKFCPGSEKAANVGMRTPDEVYYVSVDMPSALHPQTLLAWEMNDQPLTHGHGAPLRLVTPVKYGIKNIKRIGLIEYTDTRPADYWAERGYDWYSGL
ncbi:MAG: oxidoreductase, molybdopterin binding [Bryobacterales bacterium]|nr:oxidoreductase, molybdopterin binding [Bryobacterales bacterium]